MSTTIPDKFEIYVSSLMEHEGSSLKVTKSGVKREPHATNLVYEGDKISLEFMPSAPDYEIQFFKLCEDFTTIQLC